MFYSSFKPILHFLPYLFFTFFRYSFIYHLLILSLCSNIHINSNTNIYFVLFIWGCAQLHFILFFLRHYIYDLTRVASFVFLNDFWSYFCRHLHSFIHSFIHSFNHSIIHSFNHSFIANVLFHNVLVRYVLSHHTSIRRFFRYHHWLCLCQHDLKKNTSYDCHN